MSRSFKWIIGIFIGVIVVAALVAAGFFVFNHGFGRIGLMDEALGMRLRGNERIQPWRDMPMHPYLRMPGSRIGFGYSPLAFVLGGLLRLGLLTLVVVGVIALIRGMWRPRPAEVVPAPTIQTPVEPVSPLLSTCPNCGFAVQEDWKHCPNCAHDLSASGSE